MKKIFSMIIMTDLEPDDVLAIKFLSREIPLDTLLYVIVGESEQVAQKVQLGKAIFSKYGFTNFTCVAGTSSKKTYPQRCLSSFDVETTCFTEPKWTGTLEEIMLFFQDKNPIILAIKPMWELFDIPKDILANFDLYVYGSFNFRCLFKKVSSKVVADFINHSFRQVFLYESFFVSGAENTMSGTDPLFQKYVENDPFLIEMMNGWNEHIVKDCLDTTIEISLELNKEFAKYHPDWTWIRSQMDRMMNRNLKVVQSMADGDGKQMVLADQGLVLKMFFEPEAKKKRGDIFFNENGYTCVEENLTSKVQTFMQ
jgi:hypothetical protein